MDTFFLLAQTKKPVVKLIIKMFPFTITPFVMRGPNFNVRWCSKHKLPTIDVYQFSYQMIASKFQNLSQIPIKETWGLEEKGGV